jgi:PadR family transcriptional regulator PadR
MPPRRRWGPGWGDATAGGACPRRISRFLEPCLLLLLRGDASHGYNLSEGLQQFGFSEGFLDISVIYRLLREMEAQGWVTSQWDTAGSGPPRRVYHVTADGNAYLRWWIEDLRRTRDEIDHFVAAFDQLETNPGPAVAPGSPEG